MSSSTCFTPALEAFSKVKNADGQIQAREFLDVCKLVLPMIDRFGTALALVKSDVGGNITRLDVAYLSDPAKYALLHDIARAEVAAGSAHASSSNCNGLLWLTRAMDFMTALFQNLLAHAEWSMYQAAAEAYAATLKKFHGWIAAAAFKVALNLVPDRATFESKLGQGDVKGDMTKFVNAFSPLLLENHAFLKSIGFDEVAVS
eukprot:jgi/Mesen1/7042/ME000369S06367